MESENLRIRLIFGNGVLTKSQKKDLLTRSWVLLKPHHHTISDVVLYLLHSFDLFDSCPNGITLSIEGFALPDFEPTSILKDKDLICVKRKETRFIGANKAIQEANTCIEDDIVEKQPILSHSRLLANGKIDKDAGGYESETDDNEDEVEKSTSAVQNSCKGAVASKKTKASSKLENSKKKRKHDAMVNTLEKKDNQDCEHATKPRKKRNHENRINQNAQSSFGITEKCTNLETESSSESEHGEHVADTIHASGLRDRAKKVSRSTLRRRTKNSIKRLLRDKLKMDECDKQQNVSDMTACTGPNQDILANITAQSDEDSDAEGDLVPVEIRPGLIKYISSGKVKAVQEANTFDVKSSQIDALQDHPGTKNISVVKHNQVEKEAFCWNGVTNKRKGQKWGQEKPSTSTWKETRNNTSHSSWDDKMQSTSSWKDSTEVKGQSSSSWTARNQPSSSWQESKGFIGQPSSSWGDKKYPYHNKRVDFDKLIPLVDPPKAGDIVAYRLLELSAACCPELSSYRVGKITSFEPESNKVMLVPVPEYPLNIGKKTFDGDDADEQILGPTTYYEDGSLETDFMSLNDVRIMKLGSFTPSEGTTANANPAPFTSEGDNEAPDATKKVASEINNQEPRTPGTATGKKDVWEEISEALLAKKALQMKEDRWNKKVTPTQRPWSHRGGRRGAMGPTMGRFRAQNGALTR